MHKVKLQGGERTPPGLLARFASSGLEISRPVLPGVSQQLDAVIARLRAPASGVRAFVYASPEYQAECALLAPDQCAIRISSALIEAFDANEMAFVLGHEFGHFLLDHGRAISPPAETLEFFMKRRAREVSCDRVGLVACGDIESAIRAIMKIVSGLSDRHLRFDAAQFLSATLRNVIQDEDPIAVYATHPAMAVRAKCLLWFQNHGMSHYPSFDTSDARAALQKADERVEGDLLRYCDRRVKDRIEESYQEARSWIWLGAVVSDARMTTKQQSIIADMFGDEFMKKCCSAFDGLSTANVKLFVREKAEAAISELARLSPEAAERLLAEEINRSEETLIAGRKSIMRNFLSLAK